MTIDWSHIFTAIIAFVIGLIVKTLLDHNLAFIFAQRKAIFITDNVSGKCNKGNNNI